jgi:hypothetical protein
MGNPGLLLLSVVGSRGFIGHIVFSMRGGASFNPPKITWFRMFN